MAEKTSLEDMLLNKVLNSEKFQSGFEEKIKDMNNDLSKKIEVLKDKFDSKINILDDIVSSKPLTVNLGTVEKPNNELVHNKFSTIIKVLSSANRINKHIQLVGPAGSFKTTLTRQVAEAMKLGYVCMSVGQQTTVSNLLGFINAHGQYVSTPLRDAFENGKLICLDEFDSANPSTITILNSLLANDICSFPDKIVEKHPNFVCIICCNTYGTGGDINYIGRNRLDASTLDRFITIEVDYDEALEGILTKHDGWHKIIRQIRANIKQQGIKMVVSPRASFQGADLLDAGFDIGEVLNMVVFKGVSADVQKQITKDINFYDLKKKKDKPLAKKTFNININFDKQVYSLYGLEVDSSIVGDQDWGSPYTFMLGTNDRYKPIYQDKVFFLNNTNGNAVPFALDKGIDLSVVASNFIASLEGGAMFSLDEKIGLASIEVTYNSRTYRFEK